jgi:hypothetical protein
MYHKNVTPYKVNYFIIIIKFLTYVLRRTFVVQKYVVQKSIINKKGNRNNYLLLINCQGKRKDLLW